MDRKSVSQTVSEAGYVKIHIFEDELNQIEEKGFDLSSQKSDLREWVLENLGIEAHQRISTARKPLTPKQKTAKMIQEAEALGFSPEVIAQMRKQAEKVQ